MLVCAVVVTYHPDAAVLANLTALCAEPAAVVAVDNGSTPEELVALRQAALRLGFTLIQNGENLGIATALNLGARWAGGQGADWLLLFDQDSCVTPGFVPQMLAAFTARAAIRRLGLLVPTYRDLRHGTAIPPERLPSGGLEVAMTSGTLLPMEVYQACGPFAEELFIDLVDHEYSLRLRLAGYLIAECDAVLLHSPGTPRVHTVLGKRFETANYSPVRRYYQERNRIWMVRRYWRPFPGYCGRTLLGGLKELVKVLFVERRETAAKAAMLLRGYRDGLLGRMGRLGH